MSSDGLLSEQEVNVIRDLQDDAEQPEDDDVLEVVDSLVGRVESLEGSVTDLQKRVSQLEAQPPDGQETAKPEAATTLEQYAQVPDAEREDLLGPSDRRALAIAENWWELAHKTQKGWVVSTKRNSTKKNNPSQLKLDLERVAGEDLEWMQVYRAMERVAKLSGGESMQDDYDRTHIHGGAFEYHEKVTPDGSQTYKILVLSDEELVNSVVSEYP